MTNNNSCDNNSFFAKNQAYIYTLLGLGVVGFIFVNFLMIIDWGYLFMFTLKAIGGDVSGILSAPTSDYELFVNTAFGSNYNAIAPEIIRASNERQLFIWWVFVAEIAIFCVAYIISGRQEVVVSNPSDEVVVFSLFQRVVILANVVIMSMLVISGFNITWGTHSGGGTLPFILRGMHEMTGLIWLPFWLMMSFIAFKDAKLIVKNSVSSKLANLMLAGTYKPMRRVIFIVFVVMGAGLLFSGITMWYLHPSTLINAETIQFKRALMYLHFGASVLIMFFMLDLLYSTLVAIKGNCKGFISGKYPREYLAKIAPDVLADIEAKK